MFEAHLLRGTIKISRFFSGLPLSLYDLVYGHDGGHFEFICICKWLAMEMTNLMIYSAYKAPTVLSQQQQDIAEFTTQHTTS